MARDRSNEPMKTDFTIIGGGAIGAAVAYFLKLHDPGTAVTVIERDPTYALASTPRASGGIRRLFSLPENIALSNYRHPLFRQLCGNNGGRWRKSGDWAGEAGYLFIVPPSARDVLKRNFDTQRAMDCNVLWLEPDALKAKFPSMNVSDLGAAVYSPDDGWLDPHSVLMGFRNKARSIGADFVADEVVGLVRQGNRVTTANLKSGAQLHADHLSTRRGRGPRRSALWSM